jgi:hypothetical protein
MPRGSQVHCPLLGQPEVAQHRAGPPSVVPEHGVLLALEPALHSQLKLPNPAVHSIGGALGAGAEEQAAAKTSSKQASASEFVFIPPTHSKIAAVRRVDEQHVTATGVLCAHADNPRAHPLGLFIIERAPSILGRSRLGCELRRSRYRHHVRRSE